MITFRGPVGSISSPFLNTELQPPSPSASIVYCQNVLISGLVAITEWLLMQKHIFLQSRSSIYPTYGGVFLVEEINFTILKRRKEKAYFCVNLAVRIFHPCCMGCDRWRSDGG